MNNIRPKHYNVKSKYEVIKVLDAWGLLENFCLSNTIKYISRAGKKHENILEDLEKALWYLKYEIKRLKKKQSKK